MKLEFTETAGNLVDIMKSRNLDRDTIIGILLMLKTEDNFVQLLEWIKKNKTAGQSEIMEHHFKIVDYVPYYTIDHKEMERKYGKVARV